MKWIVSCIMFELIACLLFGCLLGMWITHVDPPRCADCKILADLLDQVVEENYEMQKQLTEFSQK